MRRIQKLGIQTNKIILVLKTVRSLANILCMRQAGLILWALKIATKLQTVLQSLHNQERVKNVLT